MEKFQDQPVVVLGVNNDANPEAARKLITARGMAWRHWRTGGADGPIHQAWRIKYLPTVYVLDAAGVIRHASASGADLENAVSTLLAEHHAKQVK